MTVDELVGRIQDRGGELRVRGTRLQYRPAGVLSAAELTWLGRHRAEMLAALGAAAPPRVPTSAAPICRPLGEAGPGVPAWHCSIDRAGGHLVGVRDDGSLFCATCHPSMDTALGTRPA